MSQGKIIERIVQRFPLAKQIQDFDTTSEPDAVRITWRGDTFRVSQGFSVEQAKGSFLESNSITIVIQALLKADIA